MENSRREQYANAFEGQHAGKSEAGGRRLVRSDVVRPSQCEFLVGQSENGDEVYVCVATGRRAAETQVFGEFQWPREGVGQPAPRALRARGLGQLRSSASGSHVLVTGCVWR